jgi:hypothetical protein
MADIAPLTSGSIPNFGGMQAQQAQAQAGANLENQQAQGAQIANQRAAMQLQLYKQGLAHVMDFDNQNGGQPRTLPDLNAQSDTSGTQSSGAASPGATSPSASPSGTQSGAPGTQSPGAQPSTVTPEDDIGESAVNQGIIESALDQKYNVDPAGTEQEQYAIHAAQANAAQVKMYGDPGLTAWADQQIEIAKTDRDNGVKSRTNASRLDASKNYDLLRAIQTAPPGQALTTLESAAGGRFTAARIRAANPNASDAELDEITRDSIAHTAGFMFRHTGRASDIGTDGVMYDKDGGYAVSGIPPRGLTQQQITDMRKEGNVMDTVTRNGQETQVPHYSTILDPTTGKPLYSNVDQYVQAGVAQARSIQAQQQGYMHVASTFAAQAAARGGGAQVAPQAGATPQSGAPGQP